MSEQLAVIQNGGAGRPRAAALTRATALAASLVFSCATILVLTGEPVSVRAGAAAIPALAAVASAFLLARAVMEHLETPKTIEFSAIILMVRRRGRRFTGLSWGEITSILPVRTRFLLLGGPLYDLNLSVLLKQDVTVQNLSLEAGRSLIAAYHQNARKLSAAEAAKLADGCFDIKRY